MKCFNQLILCSRRPLARAMANEAKLIGRVFKTFGQFQPTNPTHLKKESPLYFVLVQFETFPYQTGPLEALNVQVGR